ncbi:hypothetical protein [Polynucleobacter sp. MWH-UH35A]|uniref:hypothetical protein n=1 Tax=Polynucleobacter sp. MWH-UH35A TaxID=1855619 RepID=UPI001BFEDF6F|nr:hypothetical protein [Polynucleobacter sp. MWH-UH35A]QWD59781.1 hypothetical protein ICV36_08240 [Polynucleobacter sp. MWH-UH35A]
MKQIKITGRTVIKLAILSFSVFILFGIGIHFLGFRVAIRFSPEMTKEMGGVITRKELDEIEATYREKLQILQRQLPVIESKISALNVLKDQFSELATPNPIKTKPQNNEN